ncbi:MAG: L-threonylcarbamoyladenylate synthase [Acidobacteriota bacterium]
MERVSITEADSSPAVLARALALAVGALRAGGLVAFPTETFYGIAVDPRNEAAVRGVFLAKIRPPATALPLIAASVDQLATVAGCLSDPIRRLAATFWPGPLTLVIPAWDGLAASVHAGKTTVAVRVPGHRVARGLCEAFGYPLTSTSANLSGSPAPVHPEAVAAALSPWLAVLLDGGSTPGGLPSTIVDMTQQGGRRLVRAGATPWEQVLRCVE